MTQYGHNNCVKNGSKTSTMWICRVVEYVECTTYSSMGKICPLMWFSWVCCSCDWMCPENLKAKFFIHWNEYSKERNMKNLRRFVNCHYVHSSGWEFQHVVLVLVGSNYIRRWKMKNCIFCLVIVQKNLWALQMMQIFDVGDVNNWNTNSCKRIHSNFVLILPKKSNLG